MLMVDKDGFKLVDDEDPQVDRFWDPFRLGLFAVILGAGLTAGFSIGVGFSSWWLGLLSFVLTCLGVYGLMLCRLPRNVILRVMDPLISPRRHR